MMKYCSNCGVELEDGMNSCPLCGKPAFGQRQPDEFREQEHETEPVKELSPSAGKMTGKQKTLVWEIISITLLSAIIATLLVNFIINKRITWAEYPVGVSLAIFSYVSLFAFWSQKTLIRIAGGFIGSSVFLFMLDALTGGTDWALKIAIPILFIANLITAGLLEIINHSKYKGINLLAYIFIGGALLCICVEGVFSLNREDQLRLHWSMIVSLCVLLVSIVLLFVHFRLKKGRSLEKTFHM